MTSRVRGQVARRRLGAAVLTASLLLTAALGGCTGEDDKAEEKASPSGSTSTADAIELDLRTGSVTGSLTPAAAQQSTEQVGALVTAWWDAAYLGEHPRTTFAWPSWVPAGPAQEERAVTSNATFSSKLRSVRPVHELVRVDLLAVGGRPHAATAHFGLRYDAAVQQPGGVEAQRQEVWGRLMLIVEGGKWYVVGYDVKRKEQVVTGASS